MKKIYFALLHIFFILSLSFLYSAETEIKQYQGKYYRELVAFHTRVDRNLSDDYVIFIGDSHVQGLAVQEVYPKSVNYGIGSDTTTGVINRLPFYNSMNGAKAIVFQIGFNDLKTKTEKEFQNNMQELISMLPSKLPVFINLIFPIDEIKNNWNGISNKRIQSFNNSLLEVTASFENVTIIDAQSIMTNSDGNLSEDFHIGDGIHLNPLGYSKWIDLLKINLNEVLSS